MSEIFPTVSEKMLSESLPGIQQVPEAATINKKLALCGADSRLVCSSFTSLHDQRTSKSRDMKTRQNIKNLARTNLVIDL